MQFRHSFIFFVALLVLGSSCATQNDAPPCLVGQKISCSTTCEPATSLSGTATCLSNGQFSNCQPPQEACGNNKDDNCNGQIDENCSNTCTPGQSKQCVTACNTVGTQTCVNGQWSQCSGQDEVCDGKDNDCDQQIDEGLVQPCSCGLVQGTQQCLAGSWQPCSAGVPTVEICDGKDNDCDGKPDNEVNSSNPLTQACDSIPCPGTTQTCVNGVWSQCEGLPPYYQTQETLCDNLDNDCDGKTDQADETVAACNCVAGETEPCTNTPDGKNQIVGECGQGIRTCVDGTIWTECDGPKVQPEMCDGLDNDCDGITDNNGITVDAGAACGETNISFAGVGECQTGIIQCQNQQLVCVNGVEQAPEICDNLDNDCDGQTDEEPLSGDQWEPNNTCATSAPIGTDASQVSVLEDGPILTIKPTVYPSTDADWFRVIAKEKENACFFTGGDDAEGPYTLTVTLKGIPADQDYDLCVYPEDDSPCGTVPDGVGSSGACEELGIVKFGDTPETYTYTWDGECGGNDDKVFYIKVLPYFEATSCTPPYTLEVGVASNN